MASDDEQKKDETADMIPEVEAEVVTDTPEDNAPFDDAPGEPEIAAAGKDVDANTDDVAESDSSADAHPKKSMMSPGVMAFTALVVLSVGAGAFWYFTQDATPANNASITIPARQEPEEAIAFVEEITPPASVSEQKSSTDSNVDKADPVVDDLTESAVAEIVDTLTPDAIESDPSPAPSEDFVASAPAEDAVEEIAAEPAPEAAAIDPLAASEDAIEESVEIESAMETVAPEASVVEAQIDDETAALLAEANARLEALEAQLVDEQSRAGDMQARIDALQLSLDDANAALASATGETNQLRDQNQTLRDENLELAAAAKESPLTAAAIALNDISLALDSGASFVSSMRLLEEAAPQDASLDTLRAYADGRAPTLIDLRTEFADAARIGLSTANRELADNTLERYGARVSSLFNIRPASPQEGASPAAIISRAEYAVERGELSRALKEIDSLPEGARTAMADWTKRAQERIAAEQALAAVKTSITAQSTMPESL